MTHPRIRSNLRVQPAGKAAMSDWRIKPLSTFPATMGEMLKHLPSVGTKAVVMGTGLPLQPVPVKMERGIASTRLVRAGAALMVVAAARMVARVVNCMVAV